MEAAESHDRLVVDSSSELVQVVMGLVLIGYVAAGCWIGFRELAGPPNSNPVWLVLLAPILVLMLLGGVYFLVTRPTCFIFDRPGGELIVVHRTLVWRSERRYPLSSIRAVECRGTFDSDHDVTRYSVSLWFVTPGVDGEPREQRIELTMPCEGGDPKATADAVAAFVGVSARWTGDGPLH